MRAGSGDEEDAEDGFSGSAADGEVGEGRRSPGVDVADLRAELDALREELEAFEADVESRTLHRSAIEDELRRYVRRRIRRGHARGWGPYLVLLYGTAMTLGAFYFLGGGWAILAMVVIWLSTLGLYVLMLLVGGLVGLARLPRRAADRLQERRT